MEPKKGTLFIEGPISSMPDPDDESIAIGCMFSGHIYSPRRSVRVFVLARIDGVRRWEEVKSRTDPDDILKRAVELSDRIISTPGSKLDHETAYNLALAVADLNLWISSGGFLPDSWQRHRPDR